MPKKQEQHTTINLSDELRELLDEHCRELDLTKSELIRRALRHFIAHLKTGSVRKSFLGQCEREGFDFAKIISESIRSYVEESRAVRIEASEPTEAEKTIRKLGGEG